MLADRLINYAFFITHHSLDILKTFFIGQQPFFLKNKKMPEYNKTTNYNKKSHGRAKRGKAFKILL